MSKIDNSRNTGAEIAIIGMSCRVPGADGLTEFWNNLKNGVESITQLNDEDIIAEGEDPSVLDDKYVRANSFINGKEYFDSKFFGFRSDEARLMEPQMRVFMQTVWSAVEDAGYDVRNNEEKIGLFAGATSNVNWINYAVAANDGSVDYLSLNHLCNVTFLCSRIANVLNFQGPALFIDTACSTSLASVQKACMSLLLRECTMAVAGGVTVRNFSHRGYRYQEGMFFSKDGHCRSFDAESSGTIAGEGVGAVVLKKLDAAIRDGDHIYAVIKGSGINNDGSSKISFSSPGVDGQYKAILRAISMADVKPESIGYVEAQGTGTQMGDAIEIEALNLAFGNNKDKYCALGSVKSNIGHIDVAAGVAGLIKTVLSIQHRQLPASLHFTSPNQKAKFDNGPFFVNTGLTDWKSDQYPLRAGVSSFGVGGTNVHLIVEEAPEQKIQPSQRKDHVLIFSARTRAALERNIDNFVSAAESLQHEELADIAYTLQVGRSKFSWRTMIVCDSLRNAVKALAAGDYKVAEVNDESKTPVTFDFSDRSISANISPRQSLMELVGELWMKGVDIQWNMVYSGEQRKRVSLPAYSFDKIAYPVLVNGFKELVSKSQRKESIKSMPLDSPTSIVNALSLLWKDFFDVTELPLEKSFFEMGGDSLRAMSMIGRIQAVFGVEISLTTFFGNSTVNLLADYIFNNRIEEMSLPRPVVSVSEQRDSYPLTSAQERLLFLNKLDPDSTAYNIPCVVQLDGDLDKEKVNKVFSELIDRHASLRTSINSVDQGSVQKIWKEVGFTIEHFHASEHDAPQIIEKFVRPFDLSEAPLFRAALIEINSLKHLLVVDIHHIVCDGISQQVLINDFVKLYGGKDLPSLKFQYGDALAAQDSQTVRKHKDFWLNEFSQPVVPLNLPLDFSRPLLKTYNGNSITFSLGRNVSDGIRTFAKKSRATTFMSLLSMFGILLNKLTNKSDVVIGTPVGGRPGLEWENVVGMFVNTLPIRMQIPDNGTFGDMLDHVREKTLACFDHQEYPYEFLVNDLKVGRDTSRNALFDCLFTFRRLAVAEHTLPGLTIREYPYASGISKFDLTLDVVETEEDISIRLEYATSLFVKEKVQRFVDYFKTIAQTVASQPTVRLDNIDIISEKEKLTLAGFNRTETPYAHDKTIVDIFEEQVAKNPGNVALRFGDVSLTYLQLHELSSKTGYYLNENADVRSGDLVGVMLEREEYLIPSMFGVLKAGAAYVPIDPNYPVDRINAIIEDSKLSVVITRQRFMRGEISASVRLLDLDSELKNINECPVNRNHSRPHSRQLAYVIYTSGSTGRPKGVMIEHHSVINRLMWMQKQYPLTHSDVIMQKTPTSFDVSVWELFWWSFVGASVALLKPGEEKDPSEIIRSIEKYKVTTMHFVPSMLSMFLGSLHPEFDYNRMSSLRLVFASGEALKPGHVNKFRSTIHSGCDTRLVNLYGPTEATVDVSFFECDFSKECRMVPIGKPIDNTGFCIVNNKLQLTPLGVAGELCIAGVGLARGYLHNPKLTDEKFVDNPNQPGQRLYRTGDLARWCADGNIEYLDRIDNQVKIRGFRIELGEIESHLNNYPAVKKSIVLATGDGEDKQLVAYYASDTALSFAGIRTFLAGKLPAYMIPSYFIWMEDFPVTSNGKLDRRALPRPVVAKDEITVRPRNQVQRQLLDIWADVLEMQPEQIGINSNFFEIGGNSLKLIKVADRIKQQFDIDVKVAALFNFPVISSMSEMLTNIPVAELVDGDDVDQMTRTLSLINSENDGNNE